MAGFPVTFALGPFLARRGSAPDDVDQTCNARVKACLLLVTPSSPPCVNGDF